MLLLEAGEYGPKWIVSKVAEAMGTTTSLEKLKKQFVEEGLHASIVGKIRVKLPREIQFGGDFEAKLITLACSAASEGREKW